MIYADIRAVAEAYRVRRMAGDLDYPSFQAALDAYLWRHPDVPHDEASVTVTRLLFEASEEFRGWLDGSKS